MGWVRSDHSPPSLSSTPQGNHSQRGAPGWLPVVGAVPSQPRPKVQVSHLPLRLPLARPLHPPPPETTCLFMLLLCDSPFPKLGGCSAQPRGKKVMGRPGISLQIPKGSLMTREALFCISSEDRSGTRE